MKKLSILLITLSIILIGCSQPDLLKAKDKTKTKPKSTYEIYLTKPWKAGQDINSLELQDQPILTLNDIKKYHWQSHEIELTEEYLSQRPKQSNQSDYLVGSKVLGTKDDDKFVLVVNGERICAGGFKLSAFRSQNPSFIQIIDNSNNKIRFDVNNLSSFSMDDPRIYDALRDSGKLIENTN